MKPDITLAEKLAFLIRPESYPNHPDKIETKETHMSWVFFSKDLVYKLKKPVKFDFLDFSTLEARLHDCREEIRLNKRLAPKVYLDVIPLTIDQKGKPLVEGEGEVIDWLVKMKRLPANCMLDERIASKIIREEELYEAADLIASFYLNQKPLCPDAGSFIDRITSQAEKDKNSLQEDCYRLNKEAIAAVYSSILTFCKQQKNLLQGRIAEGRIVEGHGDLRPEHICVKASEPAIIDCLEFNRELRIVDAAEELAFLSMECELLGALFAGRVFVNVYCRHTGDGIPDSLFSFYKCKRAYLRAGLAINHLNDNGDEAYFKKWRQKAMQYLELARKYSLSLNSY